MLIQAQWCELVQSMCWNIIKNPRNLSITIRGAGLGVALHCFTSCCCICERGSYMKQYCRYWFVLKSSGFCHLLLILMSIQTQFRYCHGTQNEAITNTEEEMGKRHSERSIWLFSVFWSHFSLYSSQISFRYRSSRSIMPRLMSLMLLVGWGLGLGNAGLDSLHVK